jgi:rubrerythrin
MTQDLGLEEALDIAMEGELRARTFYAQAAEFVQDERGRDLLGRLAAFEQHHWNKLSELAQSLHVSGRYIDYEPRTVDQFSPFAGGEATGTELAELKDEASILGRAIDLEKIAGQRYRVLSDHTGDEAGRAMFQRLAEEEHVHQRILEDEFYSLSNQGKWAWSGLYGE